MSTLAWVQDERIEKRLHRMLRKLPCVDNRGTLARFLKERRALNGVKLKTLLNEGNAIRRLGEHLSTTRFEDATKDDVMEYVMTATHERTWVTKRKDGTTVTTRAKVALKPTTLAVRKQVIRCFYKWLNGGEEYPRQVRGMRINRGKAEQGLIADNILRDDECERLLQACTQLRDKALLAILIEAGLRAGELCALNVRSLDFRGDGYIDLVIPKDAPGLKTGSRRVLIVDAVEHVTAWYNAHPERRSPDAALFPSNSRSHQGRMTPAGLYDYIRRRGEQAGLDRPIHPHLFRHTAATNKVRLGLREAELRAYFGWSPTSNMPARYNHLAGQDYQDMLLERLGKKRARPQRRPLQAQTCPRGHEQPAGTAICRQCHEAVNDQGRAHLEDQRREMMAELIRSEIQRLQPPPLPPTP